MSPTPDHYGLESGYDTFVLEENLLIKVQRVLVGVCGHGLSQVHRPHEEAIYALMCSPGSLPFFRACLHLGLLQCPDYPVYCRSQYDHQYSSAELTPITNQQSHLFLIIGGDTGQLYSDYDISKGLCIVTPTAADWNPPEISVEVIDGAHYETTLLNK